MGEIKKIVNPVQVDMVCPKCGRGMMRPDNVVLTTSPPQYPHECNECGYTETYYVMYPYIMWENNEERN